VVTLLERLEGVRSTGANRWLARCPGSIHVNNDRHPSLSIRLIEADRWLLYCFAGCTAFEICMAIGIRLGDLFECGQPRRDYTHGKDRHGRPVPRVRANEFLELVSDEASVVALIAADMLSQREIDAATWGRLAEAYRRLMNARTECGSP
jgi:hypothetical protein